MQGEPHPHELVQKGEVLEERERWKPERLPREHPQLQHGREGAPHALQRPKLVELLNEREAEPPPPVERAQH